MVVLVICKNEEDSIKNEGTRVFTTLYINFSDAQGQITPELVVVSGQNLNSSKLSCMSLSPARVKLSQSKMNIFPIISLWRFLQPLKGSPWSDLAEFLTRSRCNGCPRYLQKIKKIRSKMKALECSQDFPHYNLMGAI